MKVFLLSALVSLSTLAARAAYSPEEILIKDINILDVNSKRVLPKQNVLIRNGKIEKISRRKIEGTSAKVVQGKGKYLIPGLIDVHAHVIDSHSPNQRPAAFQNDEFQLLLINGVTTIRNMKSFKRQLTLRDQIKSRDIFAPRMSVASPALDNRKDREDINDLPPTIHYFCDVDWSNCTFRDLEGAEQLVSRFKSEGFDSIKIREPVAADMLYPLVEIVKKYNMPVVGHVFDGAALEEVFVSDLFDSVEHIGQLLEILERDESPLKKEPHFSNEAAHWSMVRAHYLDPRKTEHLTKAAGNGFKGYLVPTLSVFEDIVRSASGKRDISAEPNHEYRDVCWIKKTQDLANADLEFFKDYSSFVGPGTIPKAFEKVQKLFGAFHKRGVKFAIGTDFGDGGLVPGVSMHDEMMLLSQSGLSNWDVLTSATLHGAKLINEPNLGNVRTGYLADLVILDQNPLENLNHIRKIHAVIRDGVLLDYASIQQIKSEVRIRAKTLPCAGSSK